MCVVLKPENEFPRVHGERRGRVCRECRNADLRCRRQGVTLLAWRSIWNAQGGRCGVCRDPLGRAARIDAQTATQIIRGLVCRRCYAWLRALDEGVIEHAAVWVYGYRMGQLRTG